MNSVNASAEKRALYAETAARLAALIDGVRDREPNLANAAALIYHSLPDVSWAGFYLMKDGRLLLSSFQGKPACVEISVGKGVCGTVAKARTALAVPDVHLFEGHIACDSASNSEAVVPIFSGDRLVGVIDLDSELLNRFDGEDLDGLAAMAGIIGDGCDF